MGAAKLLATSEGAELVRRCRAGDGAAWEEIVQTYSRRIYNLAYRFTSKADAAEDLTQEVFIRVYRSLDQYNPKQGDLQNWLMRLARNLIIDDYRKRQRAPQDEAAEDHEIEQRRVSGEQRIVSLRTTIRYSLFAIRSVTPSSPWRAAPCARAPTASRSRS